MSQKFDFETQELVAVVKEGPEKGQHVHVSADDLVRELREWADRKRSVTSSTEIVHVETLPQDYQDELAALNRKFSDMQSAIAELQERPQVTQPANDEVAVPAAFGKLVENVAELAGQVADIEDGMAGLASLKREVVPDGGELADEMADLAATSLNMFRMLQNELGELRRRVNKTDGEVLDLIDNLQIFAREQRRA